MSKNKKIMNKLLRIGIFAAIAFSFIGCYNDFDDPAPAKVWTKEDFSKDQLISIKDFKQLFYGSSEECVVFLMHC